MSHAAHRAPVAAPASTGEAGSWFWLRSVQRIACLPLPRLDLPDAPCLLFGIVVFLGPALGGCRRLLNPQSSRLANVKPAATYSSWSRKESILLVPRDWCTQSSGGCRSFFDFRGCGVVRCRWCERV